MRLTGSEFIMSQPLPVYRGCLKMSESGSSGETVRPEETVTSPMTKDFGPNMFTMFLLLNYNSITVPRPKINHTWLSEGRNQTLLYKAEWPSLASLLRYEVPASDPSSPSLSPSPPPLQPSRYPSLEFSHFKKYSEEGQGGGVGAQAGQLAGPHEVANRGDPGQQLVERGRSRAHSSQEGVAS